MTHGIQLPEPQGREEAAAAVREYVREKYKQTEFEVIVVWHFSQGKNWKILLTTSLQDEVYYEVNYRYGRVETTLDVYMKVDSIRVS
jgi:hypothetical protein